MKKFLLALSILLLGASACFAKTTLNVATFNMRLYTDSDKNAGNGWEQRGPVCARLAMFHDFDIFGTQELYKFQIDDMLRWMPGYNYIGVARDDGKEQGEHSAIFYRTDVFEVVESGNFWLSETPDRPGKGWDAACVRICTWGHFKDKKTGFEFLMFNLHMDHIGVVARNESALLIQKKVKEFGATLPVILTGDFNIDQRGEGYFTVLKTGLKDSYELAEMRYAENGTFNSWYSDRFTDQRIDHVFVSPCFKVKKYGVLTDSYRRQEQGIVENPQDSPAELMIEKYSARMPSDHFPVKVILEVE
ncbi:MAG: endonuclease/exonuclease/phosphatase family protein [Muribaculaceae bacterium]|nr:endonuclease/exonuclease/phosphatase family protein [Muribaculaceae bacterium]